MQMSRFDAEAIVRSAASGAIPTPGDVLLRVQDGWIFGRVNFEDVEGEIGSGQVDTLPFFKITGVAARGQLPPEIAYEDEANVFLLLNTFQNQVRRGIRTITVADSPYSWAADDWHLNVNTDGGPVTVLVPDASLHSVLGFTDQLHFKKIGNTKNTLLLSPAVSGQRIDGYDSATIRTINRSFTLVSDGADWWIQ